MIFKSQVVVLAAAASAVIVAPARSQTVLHANQSIVTETGIGFGGADISRSDVNGNNSTGWSWSKLHPKAFADDFVLSSSSFVGSIVFRAYQTSYTGTTGPFSNVTANIWSGRPGDTGSSILFTSTTLGTQSFSNIYRVSNIANQLNTTRKVWDVEVLFPSVALNAGTYWWDVSGDGSPSITDIWVPTTQLSSGNALQLVSGVWNPPQSTAVEMDFKVIGGAAPGAVPEPGEWAAMGILGAGLAGLVLRRRRR
jgi:hypothetical protein